MTSHSYPSNHRPGTHWATDKAWQILDTLPAGLLPDDYRFLLGGMIAGALLRQAAENDALVRMRMVVHAAAHALRSYEHGNASADLAREVAERCEQLIRLTGGDEG